MYALESEYVRLDIPLKHDARHFGPADAPLHHQMPSIGINAVVESGNAQHGTQVGTLCYCPVRDLCSIISATPTPGRSSVGCSGPGTVMDIAEEARSLRGLMLAAELELECKELEIHAFRPLCAAESNIGDGAAALREEHRRLAAEVRVLAERHRLGGERKRALEAEARSREHRIAELETRFTKLKLDPLPQCLLPSMVHAAPHTDATGAGAGTSRSSGGGGAWRQRAAQLEDELNSKAAIVTRLQQRELWFEQQIQRQAEANAEPWEALVDDLGALLRKVNALRGAAATWRAPDVGPGTGAWTRWTAPGGRSPPPATPLDSASALSSTFCSLSRATSAAAAAAPTPECGGSSAGSSLTVFGAFADAFAGAGDADRVGGESSSATAAAAGDLSRWPSLSRWANHT